MLDSISLCDLKTSPCFAVDHSSRLEIRSLRGLQHLNLSGRSSRGWGDFIGYFQMHYCGDRIVLPVDLQGDGGGGNMTEVVAEPKQLYLQSNKFEYY